MFPQQPFKYVCPKCGYSKTVTPKSDVINPMDMIRTCPKCGGEMEKSSDVNMLDILKGIFTK
jgi:predicted nucleic acid-binding Zn ribbon protein